MESSPHASLIPFPMKVKSEIIQLYHTKELSSGKVLAHAQVHQLSTRDRNGGIFAEFLRASGVHGPLKKRLQQRRKVFAALKNGVELQQP